METITIGKVNGFEMQVIDLRDEKLVPIEPICKLLGIELEYAEGLIRGDDRLNKARRGLHLPQNDGETVRISCLVLRFIFEFLFLIKLENIEPEARLQLFRYKFSCEEMFLHYWKPELKNEI